MRVVVQNRFSTVRHGFERAAIRAVDRASRDGVRATRSSPTRYRIGGILGKTRVVKARLVGNMIRGGFVNPDFRELFFEYGTLKKRRKPLKRPRRRQVKKGGITPQYAMTKGRRVAKAKLPGYLKDEMRKVR